MDRIAHNNYSPARIEHGLFSFEYRRAAKILASQSPEHRDWDLDSASAWVRKAMYMSDMELSEAERNLREVLKKYG